MAAAQAGFDWRSSPIPQPSPDTASPVFPERPIRPKPKRSLRARLSPEQAESIIFPPAPPSSAQLFSFPYSQVDRPTNTPPRGSRTEHHQHTCECGAHQSELESEEEEDDRHLPLHSSPTAERGGREIRGGSMNTAFAQPPKAPSTTSSADGYESFENTNNKKKRKIPNQSSGSSHHANLSAEMAGMGLSSNGRHAYDELDDLARSSHASAAGSVTSGTGISGAGRGRYGRGAPRAPERRPLGASTNALNAAKSGPSPGGHQEYSRGAIEQGPRSEGIISTAIANAQAHTPPTGSENISLLHQQASKAAPNAGQFTFTVESDSANRMVWPGQNGTYPPGAEMNDSYRRHEATRNHPDKAGQDTKALNEAGGRHAKENYGPQGTNGVSAHQQQYAPQHPSQTNHANNQAASPPRKPRRRPSKEFALAARQRKVQQQFSNWHHPLRREDVWICEFCEYEEIFGEPPRALIRQYEIKDKKERKKLAEKRRLLEKAKMKGRKGKRGSKSSKNNAQHQSHANAQAQAGHQQPRADQSGGPHHDLQDDYYEDDLDENSDDPPELEPLDNPYPNSHANVGAPQTHPHHQPPGIGHAGGGKSVVNGA